MQGYLIRLGGIRGGNVSLKCREMYKEVNQSKYVMFSLGAEQENVIKSFNCYWFSSVDATKSRCEDDTCLTVSNYDSSLCQKRHATCCWRLIQQLADSTGSDWSVESALSEASLAWDDLWSESQVCRRVYGPSSWLILPSIDLLLISIASFIQRPSSRPAFKSNLFIVYP